MEIFSRISGERFSIEKFPWWTLYSGRGLAGAGDFLVIISREYIRSNSEEFLVTHSNEFHVTISCNPFWGISCYPFRGISHKQFQGIYMLPIQENNWKKCRPSLGKFLGMSREIFFRISWELFPRFSQEFLKNILSKFSNQDLTTNYIALPTSKMEWNSCFWSY